MIDEINLKVVIINLKAIVACPWNYNSVPNNINSTIML